MVAALHTTWATAVLQVLPDRLIGALDAWSARVARNRAQARRKADQRRKAALTALQQQPRMLIQPWRD